MITPVWENLAPTWHGTGESWAGIFERFVYNPNVRVWVGGVEVSDVREGPVTVRRGRDTVYQPTNAGYASFDYVNFGDVPLRVGLPVLITIDDFLGAARPVFTGTVSDFERALNVFDPTDPRVGVRVQAVGPLARIHRRVLLFGGRPAENDAERVAAALAAADFSTDLVDDGLFDLAPLPADDRGYDPLSVIQDAAFSSQGILFETPDGQVGYANGDRRFFNLRNDVVDLPLDVTAFDRFRVGSQLADVVNSVTVEFGVDDAVTDSDPESIGLFGEFDLKLSTVLADQSTAETFAVEYLGRHSFPRLQLQEIGLGLEIVNGLLLEQLLALGACGCQDAVRVQGIPARLGITRFEGFVEGLEWRLDKQTAELRLLVSDAELSVGAVRWSGVDPSIEWQDVEPTLTWQDARDVLADGS